MKKMTNKKPKTLVGLVAAVVVGGILANVATAPAVAQYRKLKNKVAGA